MKKKIIKFVLKAKVKQHYAMGFRVLTNRKKKCIKGTIKYFSLLKIQMFNKTGKYLISLIISTCLLRNLYAGQEATIKTGHGTTDWFQIRKGVCQG